MNISEKLKETIAAVNWDSNTQEVLSNNTKTVVIADCNYRLALWSNQIEKIDNGNPALPFIREMQASGFNASVLVSLALYKPAASAMRTILETALYYTYFRTHKCELATLVRDSSYYLHRSEIIDYHRLHTSGYSESENLFGLNNKMVTWYKKVSSLVHGQIPGGWVTYTSISDIKHATEVLDDVIATYVECITIVGQLLLCTVGKELWSSIDQAVKKELLHGVSGEIKFKLGFDGA